MTNLYEIIGNLLAAFVVGLLAYLAPKARAWFLANTDAATQKRLQLLIQSFARAAEQLYHDQDPAGTQRKQFVQDQLRALGVEVTEAVINMIEGAVWEINTENKKALVQTKEIVFGNAEEDIFNFEKVKGTSAVISRNTVIYDSDHAFLEGGDNDNS